MTRSSRLRQRIAEAEIPFEEITQPMILLMFLIGENLIPSFEAFRNFLEHHGLGNFIEVMIPRSHDRTFVRTEIWRHGRLNAFYFIFRRRDVQKARELEEAVVNAFYGDSYTGAIGHFTVQAYAFDQTLSNEFQTLPSGTFLPRRLLNRRSLWHHDHGEMTSFYNNYARRRDPLDPFRDNPPTV